MEKRRILWISDSPSLPTGNGKITREFIKNIQDTGLYEVTVIGRGYEGWPKDDHAFGCAVFPMDIGRPYPDVMRIISREVKPQVVISCLDMWQIDWIEHAKHSNAVYNIGYISIYGEPVPYSWKKIVKSLDLAICYSAFGKKVLNEFLPFTAIDMIHLGVNSELYRPLENRSKLRDSLALNDKFVIGCIARNQTRKRLDKLIEGFALFAKKHENAYLFLKTEPISETGYDIPDLLDYYDIKKKTTIEANRERGWHTEEKLVELYNLFDVYVQTAGAEGFGVPILEAMACGVPVIAPDYSACSELVKNNGILLKPYFNRIVDMASVEQVSINVDELSEALDNLYNDSDKRFELAKKGRLKAQNISWKHFSERWLTILSRVKWE